MREVKPPELGERAQAVLDLDLPSMAEVTARPLVTEARVPANVRAKWAKCFAKLCADAVYHKDNAKFWVLWAMFQQAALCKAPMGQGKELPVRASGPVGT